MNKQRRWDEVFDLLVSYKNEYGNCLVPANFIINDYNLGEWVRQQRKLLKNPNNDCKRYKVKKLNSINFIWDENDKWGKISNQMGMDNNDCKTYLKNIVIRRNQIVHEGDYTDRLSKRQDIFLQDVIDIRKYILDLGKS